MSSKESVTSDATTSSSFSSKIDEDDSPAAFSVVIATSSDSTPDDHIGTISVLIRDEEERYTDRMVLRFSHSHPTCFQRGHSDLFVISNQPSLGNLESVEIYYNPSSGEAHDKPWKLESCYVFHHENGKIYNCVLDEKKSSGNTFTLTCKDEPVQIIPTKLHNPFK